MVSKKCTLYRCGECRIVIGWEDRAISKPTHRHDCPVCGENRWQEVETVARDEREGITGSLGENIYVSEEGDEMTGEEIMTKFDDDDAETEVIGEHNGYIVDGIEYRLKGDQENDREK